MEADRLDKVKSDAVFTFFRFPRNEQVTLRLVDPPFSLATHPTFLSVSLSHILSLSHSPSQSLPPHSPSQYLPPHSPLFLSVALFAFTPISPQRWSPLYA